MKRIYTYMCLLLLSVLSFAVTGCDDDDDDDDEYLTEAERAVLAAQAKKDQAPAAEVEVDPAEGFAPCAVVRESEANEDDEAPQGVVIPLVVSGFVSSRRRHAAKRLVEWLESDEGAATPLVPAAGPGRHGGAYVRAASSPSSSPSCSSS